MLALRTGRPVRLVLTLEETFQAVRRASCKTHIRSGFNADGTLVSQDIEADFLVGAYADISPRVVSKASFVACGPYRTPNARITGRAILSHTRSEHRVSRFWHSSLSFALESQMDEAAERFWGSTGRDPAAQPPVKGEVLIPGDTLTDGGWADVVQKAAAAVGWGNPCRQIVGAAFHWGLRTPLQRPPLFRFVRLHHDGSLSIMSATSDMGQGPRTVLPKLLLAGA